uniref:5-deoxy-glucuronate isomerase n=1 Tax=Streptomyces aurantiacus TaxID=47760 RepID=UPI000AA9E62E
MTSAHHLPAGRAASGPYAVDVTPESAGWAHSGLRVLELPPGSTHLFTAGDSEWIVISLGGGCTVAVTDDYGRDEFALHGRQDVFSGVSDFVYVPRDATAALVGHEGGGRVP